jgi:cystathionine beta-synthase
MTDANDEGLLRRLVVALAPDTGRNYLSKFLDDEWLKANNLVLNVQPAHSVGDLLHQRGSRQLVTTSPEATVADAINLMKFAAS